jgi:phage-related protein
MTNPDLPFVWVGASQCDLRAMPLCVRRDIGQALHAMHQGVTDPAVRPVRTYRREDPIMEVSRRYRRVTHRVVFALYDNAVWVLRGYPEQSKAALPEPRPRRAGARPARRRR